MCWEKWLEQKKQKQVQYSSAEFALKKINYKIPAEYDCNRKPENKNYHRRKVNKRQKNQQQ